MQSKSNEADHAEDFGDLIKEFGYGSVNEQATKQLREVIAACRETQLTVLAGKAGRPWTAWRS